MFYYIFDFETVDLDWHTSLLYRYSLVYCNINYVNVVYILINKQIRWLQLKMHLTSYILSLIERQNFTPDHQGPYERFFEKKTNCKILD